MPLKRKRVVAAAVLFLSVHAAHGAEIPRFFGIYVMQDGKYAEVRRVQATQREYGHRMREPGGRDFNVKYTIQRSAFVAVDIETFNKEGFLVVQDPEWSEFELFRVPHTGKWASNESRQDVITAVKISGSMMGMPISAQGLDPAVNPERVELRKARVGGDVFVLVPASPLDPGCYFVDFKKNGGGMSGFNPIEILGETRQPAPPQYLSPRGVRRAPATAAAKLMRS